MAQKMVYLHNLSKNKIDANTQTNDSKDFQFSLSNFKFVRVYKSKSYKDYVISLNFGKCKKYKITKSMWNKFKKFLPQINDTLGN
jgi:hypothetical protein